MKKLMLMGMAAVLATCWLAADTKDEVKSAAKKLGDADCYSWKSTTEMGAGGRGGGPVEGKALKDGTTCLSMVRGENTIEAVLQSGKAAIKTADGWKTAAEAGQDDGSGQRNPARMVARMVQNFKAPAAQVADLVDKVKELKKDGDAYAGELTEEGAKAQMTFGGRGGNGPEISGAKGSVKVWVKDGLVSKMELKVQGKITRNGNDVDIDRTTITEIKDVGTTKVTIPEDAKKKLS